MKKRISRQIVDGNAKTDVSNRREPGMFCGETEQPQTFISETSYVKIIFFAENYTDQVQIIDEYNSINNKIDDYIDGSFKCDDECHIFFFRHTLRSIHELNNKWKCIYDTVNILNCIQIGAVKWSKGMWCVHKLIFNFRNQQHISTIWLIDNCFVDCEITSHICYIHHYIYIFPWFDSIWVDLIRFNSIVCIWSGRIANESFVIAAFKHAMYNHQPIQDCIRGR